jgi:outer membrane protein TolC
VRAGIRCRTSRQWVESLRTTNRSTLQKAARAWSASQRLVCKSTFSTANQGNVDADRAGVERAREELTRIELSLRDRYAAVADDYRSARLIASRYRDEILPRTRRAYVLITTQYGLMDASFSRILNLQRELYSAEVGYLDALQNAQINHVVLDGFLYSGGLDAPEGADPSMSGASPERSTSGRMPAAMMPHDLNYPNAKSSIFDNGLQP